MSGWYIQRNYLPLAKKQSNQTKTKVKLSPSFISVDFITNFLETQVIQLDAETCKNLQVQIELINYKIEKWLKKQTVYVHIYKKVVQNISDDYYLVKWAKNDHSDHKLIFSKNVYSNYSKSFLQAKQKIQIDYLKNQIELLIVKDPSRKLRYLESMNTH